MTETKMLALNEMIHNYHRDFPSNNGHEVMRELVKLGMASLHASSKSFKYFYRFKNTPILPISTLRMALRDNDRSEARATQFSAPSNDGELSI